MSLLSSLFRQGLCGRFVAKTVVFCFFANQLMAISVDVELKNLSDNSFQIQITGNNGPIERYSVDLDKNFSKKCRFSNAVLSLDMKFHDNVVTFNNMFGNDINSLTVSSDSSFKKISSIEFKNINLKNLNLVFGDEKLIFLKDSSLRNQRIYCSSNLEITCDKFESYVPIDVDNNFKLFPKLQANISSDINANKFKIMNSTNDGIFNFEDANILCKELRISDNSREGSKSVLKLNNTQITSGYLFIDLNSLIFLDNAFITLNSPSRGLIKNVVNLINLLKENGNFDLNDSQNDFISNRLYVNGAPIKFNVSNFQLRNSEIKSTDDILINVDHFDNHGIIDGRNVNLTVTGKTIGHQNDEIFKESSHVFENIGLEENQSNQKKSLSDFKQDFKNLFTQYSNFYDKKVEKKLQSIKKKFDEKMQEFEDQYGELNLDAIDDDYILNYKYSVIKNFDKIYYQDVKKINKAYQKYKKDINEENRTVLLNLIQDFCDRNSGDERLDSIRKSNEFCIFQKKVEKIASIKDLTFKTDHEWVYVNPRGLTWLEDSGKIIAENDIQIGIHGSALNDGIIVSKKGNISIDSDNMFVNRKIISAFDKFFYNSSYVITSNESNFFNSGDIYAKESKLNMLTIENIYGNISGDSIVLYSGVQNDHEIYDYKYQDNAMKSFRSLKNSFLKSFSDITRDEFEGAKESDNNSRENSYDEDSAAEVIEESVYKPREIGYFLNLNGQLIANDYLRINGSGSVYNTDESILSSKGECFLNINGQLVNKYSSSIAFGQLFVEDIKAPIADSSNIENNCNSDFYCEMLSAKKKIKNGVVIHNAVDSSMSIANAKMGNCSLYISNQGTFKAYNNFEFNAFVKDKDEEKLVKMDVLNISSNLGGVFFDKLRIPLSRIWTSGLEPITVNDLTIDCSYGEDLTQQNCCYLSQWIFERIGKMNILNTLTIESGYPLYINDVHVELPYSLILNVYESNDKKPTLINYRSHISSAKSISINAPYFHNIPRGIDNGTQEDSHFVKKDKIEDNFLIDSTNDQRKIRSTRTPDVVLDVDLYRVEEKTGNYDDINNNSAKISSVGDLTINVSDDILNLGVLESLNGDVKISSTNMHNGFFEVHNRNHIKSHDYSEILADRWRRRNVNFSRMPIDDLSIDQDYELNEFGEIDRNGINAFYVRNNNSYISAFNKIDINLDGSFFNCFGEVVSNDGICIRAGNLVMNYGDSIITTHTGYGNISINSDVFMNNIWIRDSSNSERQVYDKREYMSKPPVLCSKGSLEFNFQRGLNVCGYIYSGNTMGMQNYNGETEFFNVTKEQYESKMVRGDELFGNSLRYNENRHFLENTSLPVTEMQGSVDANLSAYDAINVSVKNFVNTGRLNSQYININANNIVNGVKYNIKNSTTKLIGDNVTISVYDYINNMINSNRIFYDNDSSDFMFKTKKAYSNKLPIIILSKSTLDRDIKLPFDFSVCDSILNEMKINRLGTANFRDCGNIEDASYKALKSTQNLQRLDSQEFKYLSNYVEDFNFYEIYDENDVESGLFWEVVHLDNASKPVLMPVLKLNMSSIEDFGKGIYATKARSADSSIAKIDINASGEIYATNNIISDNDISITALHDITFETGMYEEIGLLEGQTMNLHGGRFGKKKRIDTYLTQAALKKSSNPMVVKSGDNLSIIIKEDDVKDFLNTEDSHLKIIGAGIYAGKNVNINVPEIDIESQLSNSIVDSPSIARYGALNTVLPTIVRAAVKSDADTNITANVFMNKAGVLSSVGTLNVTSEDYSEMILSEQFQVAYGEDGRGGAFKSAKMAQSVYDTVVFQPEIESAADVNIHATNAHLEGNINAAKNINLTGRNLYATSNVKESGISTNAVSRNVFSSAKQSSRQMKTSLVQNSLNAGESCNIKFDDVSLVSVRINAGNISIESENLDNRSLHLYNELYQQSKIKKVQFLLPVGMQAEIKNYGNKLENILNEFNENASKEQLRNVIKSKDCMSIVANGIGFASSTFETIKKVSGLLKEFAGKFDFSLVDAFKKIGLGTFKYGKISSVNSSFSSVSVPTTFNSKGDICCIAKSGDLTLGHCVAMAEGNQQYEAYGSILMNPGENYSSTYQEARNQSFSVNAFTKSFSVGVGRNMNVSEKVEYSPSKIESKGKNVFKAGKDIIMIAPQITGESNSFDAIEFVKLSGISNEETSESYSYNIGISNCNFQTDDKSKSGIAKNTSSVLSNLAGGRGNGYKRTAVDSYINGIVDFMKSKVENEGVVVMDISNHGSNYVYKPRVENEDRSNSYVVRIPGIDVSSPEKFLDSIKHTLVETTKMKDGEVKKSQVQIDEFIGSISDSLKNPSNILKDENVKQLANGAALVTNADPEKVQKAVKKGKSFFQKMGDYLYGNDDNKNESNSLSKNNKK